MSAESPCHFLKGFFHGNRTPYRFHTIDDMKSFIGGYSNTQYRHLVQVAKKHTIIQPPILSLIPERLDFSLYNAKATVHQIIKDIELTFYTDESSQQKETKHFDFAEDVPRSYFDLISALLSQGQNILKKKKTTTEVQAARSWPLKERYASAKIQDMIDFDELLADMLRYYLNTKNRNVGIFVVKSIFFNACVRSEETSSGQGFTRKMQRTQLGVHK